MSHHPLSARTEAPRRAPTVRIAALLAIALLPLSAAPAHAVAGVPGPVIDLAADPQNGAVELSFDAPGSDGGAAIDSYEYSVDGGAPWHLLATSADPPYTATVGDLTNGVQAVFWVRAHNPAGGGESTGPVAATPRTVPDAPALASVDGGDGVITAAWAAPGFDGGGDITGYSLRATPSDQTAPVLASADPQDTTGSIQPVANGITFEVQVAAINDAGTGPWSNPITAEPVAPSAMVTWHNLPVRIHVGGPRLSIPLAITLDKPRSSVHVALQRPLSGAAVIRGNPSPVVAETTLMRDAPGTMFTGTLDATPADFTAWGPHQWQAEPQGPSATTWVSVSVRVHSLLGLSVTRSGEWIVVKGSARAYHSVLDVYKPWNARPVELQRWNGDGWTTIRSYTTDPNGNLGGAVKLPWKAGLRLVTPDTPAIWGATSATMAM